MRARTLVAASIGALISCGGDDAPVDPEPDYSCDAEWHPRCDHPLDRLLIPRLRAAGIPLDDGPAEERCRRLHIDLLDRIPKVEEQRACVAAPFEQTVAALVRSPEHVAAQQARWSELFAVDLQRIATLDTLDLDGLAGRLERGELGYGDFASAVVVHPGYFALHPYDDWAGALYPLFLGRAVRKDEMLGLRPLTRIWFGRYYIEGAIWWQYYRFLLDAGLSEAEAAAGADPFVLPRPEYAVNPCACRPGLLTPPCASTALGRPITFTGTCVDPDLYQPDNFFRLTEASPGTTDRCPDGTTRPECADRDGFMPPYSRVVPFTPAPAALRADLAEVGAALVARNDFWEAAADRELRWWLGWWQTTFRHPDSDLPAIRAYLAQELRNGRSLRDVRQLILTSLLYRLPTLPPSSLAAAALPPWTMGPTKLLTAEGWLRSAALAVGESADTCDARFVARGGVDLMLADQRYYRYVPSSIDELVDDPSFARTQTVALGGCNADDLRPTRSNVGHSFTQAGLARVLCGRGRAVTPAGWGGDLGEAADHLAETIFARRLSAMERAELVGEMQACLAAGDAGCTSPDVAARWMCRRMIGSIEFPTY